MTPHQVAEAMTRIGVPTLPRTVVAAEEGVHRPGESYLFALPSVLWCAVTELMGAQPRTLREFRLARQLNADQVAARIGMDSGEYARAEYEEFWTGDSGRTRELSEVLGVPLPYLIEVIGQDTELVERLRTAVLGRWKPHVRSLSWTTGAAEPLVADALRTLCEEYAAFEERYMGHLVARNGDARLRVDGTGAGRLAEGPALPLPRAARRRRRRVPAKLTATSPYGDPWGAERTVSRTPRSPQPDMAAFTSAQGAPRHPG